MHLIGSSAKSWLVLVGIASRGLVRRLFSYKHYDPCAPLETTSDDMMGYLTEQATIQTCAAYSERKSWSFNQNWWTQFAEALGESVHWQADSGFVGDDKLVPWSASKVFAEKLDVGEECLKEVKVCE